MKVICDGLDLSDAVLKVSKALSIKSTNPVLEGIKIINNMCNTMSGFAIPKFVVDTPELGKIILAPCSNTALSDGKLYLSSPQGECVYKIFDELI